jgi:hypothetical protein
MLESGNLQVFTQDVSCYIIYVVYITILNLIIDPACSIKRT